MLVLLCVGLVALTVGATTPPLPSTCVHLPNSRFVGGNLNSRPLAVPSASACCNACLNYKGDVPCVAYTFDVSAEGSTQCWLKRGVVYARPSFLGTAGFPNFFYNATYPDLSNDMGAHQQLQRDGVSLFLGTLLAGSFNAKEMPLRLSLELVDGEWKFDVSLGGRNMAYYPPDFPSFTPKRLPEECELGEAKLNIGTVSASTARLPILNLKCPEDCRKACYDHQEESGRYSCVAYNFKYQVPVSECWLKAAPVLQTPQMGMVTGRSGREGWEMGPAPTDYLRLRDMYRELIANATICIDSDPDA